MLDVTISVQNYCTGNLVSFASAFKNIEEFKKEIEKNLLQIGVPKEGTSKEEKDDNKKGDNLYHVTNRRQQIPPNPTNIRPGFESPFDIGRSDLDPLGRLGVGGMYFDPFRPGHGRGCPRIPGLPP